MGANVVGCLNKPSAGGERGDGEAFEPVKRESGAEETANSGIRNIWIGHNSLHLDEWHAPHTDYEFVCARNAYYTRLATGWCVHVLCTAVCPIKRRPSSSSIGRDVRHAHRRRNLIKNLVFMRLTNFPFCIYEWIKMNDIRDAARGFFFCTLGFRTI